MAAHTILMSNLGYLRCINGRLIQHLLYAHRHFYCPVDTQKRALQQLISLIDAENPDICCFVEIDKGSTTSAHFNQLEMLIGEKYPHYAIENKYGAGSRLYHLPRTRGKSNAFIAKESYRFETFYFHHGIKRLIYRIHIAPDITLFFAHFSLKREVRLRQLEQVRQIIDDTPGQSIFLGDFNILTGFGELAPLLSKGDLRLMNRGDSPTFTFHSIRKVLDLCICSASLASRLNLRVIPQPFSDHDALLVEIGD